MYFVFKFSPTCFPNILVSFFFIALIPYFFLITVFCLFLSLKSHFLPQNCDHYQYYIRLTFTLLYLISVLFPHKNIVLSGVSCYHLKLSYVSSSAEIVKNIVCNYHIILLFKVINPKTTLHQLSIFSESLHFLACLVQKPCQTI